MYFLKLDPLFFPHSRLLTNPIISQIYFFCRLIANLRFFLNTDTNWRRGVLFGKRPENILLLISTIAKMRRDELTLGWSVYFVYFSYLVHVDIPWLMSHVFCSITKRLKKNPNPNQDFPKFVEFCFRRELN